MRSIFSMRAGAMLLLVFAALCMPTGTQAQTITVDTTEDENNSDGDCSLREALQAASTNAMVDQCSAGSIGTDTIMLPAGTFMPSIDHTIDSNLTIQGVGTDTIIDGTAIAAASMFSITSGAFVIVRDLRITNAVQALYVTSADALIARCSMTMNDGVPIYLDTGSAVTINDSQFFTNSSSASASAVYAGGDSLTIDGSTFANNFFESTVVLQAGTLNVVNSTFTTNNANVAAIQLVDGSAVISATTIYGNTGEGIFLDAAASLALKSTIIAQNGPTHDVNLAGGIFNNQGYNIVGTSNNTALFSAAGDMVLPGFTLPGLADNGGYTFTMLPGPGSAAIDAGSCTTASGNDVDFDQRDVARPLGAACDAGAVEAGGAAPEAIPTAGEWGLLMLFGLLSGLMLRAMGRTQVPQR